MMTADPEAEAEAEPSQLVVDLRTMAARLYELADQLAVEHGLESTSGT